MDWTYTDQINSVGNPIDSEVFAELKANILEAAGPASSTANFNGLTGRAVTIASQGGTAYIPQITPLGVPDGSIGEVSVVINSATQFTVYNTGDNRGQFAYKVMK